MEEGRNNPYDNFFASSQSSLTPAPCDPSRKRRLQNIFSNLSLLRPPVNQSMGLRERLKRPFHVHAPANSNQGERTPEGRVGGGEERGRDVDLHPCSANITPCTIQQNDDKSEQREEPPAGTNTPPPDDTLPRAALDSNDNRKLWKSIMGVRVKGTASSKKSPANMIYNSSSEVVEVYAARGFQRFVAYKPKRKNKSPALTTSASTTAGLVSGSSPAGTPSQGGSAEVPTLSHTVTGQPGLSAHAPQSSSSHYVTT
ncbi:hypothetical protein K503DRAFT_778110, partial [Rhizopogon vinicolor AM-OR11-026]